ncbi:adenylyl-sulfate reductase subunit beta [Desulfonatronum thioautotrophicum]|uniref:adenylyl-sulfate reductase subunit beta n=1 Tax=Desulfonatronum thioautotrophicum TaxID=617001 RepID=UPI0005EBCEA1|nr:adenylyl-sulfate reductase subunit beta [Desulfonatronum thioautotrophicum]
MPTFVNPEKCDGCKGGEKTACMYICPNDLMILDAQEMKAFNQEPDACWECYSCVKICPQGAIEARPYADFAPMGGTSIPLRSGDSIMWTIKFRNGNIKRFKFPIRTTAEGSIKPYEGKPEPGDLESELLFTETELKKPGEVLEGKGKTFEPTDPDYTQCWFEPTCEPGNRV